MQYNIHPLIVHFPIAFLFLYSIITLLPFKKVFPSISWKDVSRALLFFGVLGVLAARATGEMAAQPIEEGGQPSQLLEMHEFFSGAVLFFYGLMLVGNISGYLANQKYIPFTKIWKFIENLFVKSWVVFIFSFLGLLALFLTGLLGGVMVYGVSIDPIAPLVLDLLGISA